VIDGNSVTRVGGLSVRKWGQGETLVLLHGGMGSWRHWIRNLDALAARFTVLAVDMPGCGDSDSVPRDIADDDYITLVEETLAAIGGARPFNLAGFSFGGIMAALVAARMGSRIRKLSLVSPGGFGKSPQPLDLRKIPPDAAGMTAVREVLRHNLLVMMCADPASITEETVDLHYANVRRTRFDGRRFSVSNRMGETLRHILCPIQTIWGERDALPYPDVHARIAVCRAAVPGIRADVVPGAGHWVQYEAPEPVNRALLDFFST
jgi:2-hydroxy-6-oxonona-2,4-dienedioate hydrolase